MVPRAMASAATAQPVMNSWFEIKASGNQAADIWIYDEIGGWGITARQFANDLKALGDIRNISLHIHSPGGDVFEGMAIYNLLDQHPAQITVKIDGLAASMASVIAMVGDEVQIPENAMLMIHKPWGIQGGDANDMRRYAELLDKVESTLISAYTKKTGKTSEEIAALLHEETWLSGAEAVDSGFADSLVSPLHAAACFNSNRMKDFEKMPDTLKNLMNPRSQAPQVPVSQPEPTQTPAPENNSHDFLANIQARNTSIRNLFASFGNKHMELMNDCLADVSLSEEQVKDKLLEALGKGTEPTNTVSASPHIFAGNGNAVGDAMRAALMMRAGHQADGTAPSDARDNPYTHMTLRELARMSLTERGIGVASYNPMQMVGMAFTHGTSDFGQILLDVAHKSLLQGWESAEETFERWTMKGTLTDFKIAHRVGLEAFPNLRKVRPGAEYKFATVGERGEKIALATYGEMFSIDRQTIINDDLQALTELPMLMGEAAKATVGDLVYGILLDGYQMNDGKQLFDAEHKNYISKATAMDIAGLDQGRQMMRSQKSGERHLNIRPGYVLVPTALETTANQVIKSASVKGADVNAGVVNPLQNFAEVIAEPRLDDAATLDWYLTAARGRDTIEVAYLNGVETPFIEQQQGFNVDGVVTKVRIDAGVAPRDYRGMVKAKGVAKS
nr:ClpP-like prohead protease/major capsid protein fusion protein [Photobacterium galatheae]